MIFGKRLTLLFLVLQFILAVQSCRQAADDPKEASEILTVAPKWLIEEITVNDAITFKNGKLIKQFGGIDFERYMEMVRFKTNGDFEGYFIGDTKPMLLRWKLNKADITVVAVDNKGGAWTILPEDVTKDSFIMKTQSTAYDYPRMTKIALKFKSK